MRRARTSIKVIAVVAALAAAAAAAYVASLARTTVPYAEPIQATDQPGASSGRDVPAELISQRVFFGHQSVGDDILRGLTQVAARSGGTEPVIRRVASAGELPQAQGYVADAIIGNNTQPLTKIADFDRLVRSGIGDEVDVALMKLCYVDFNRTTDPRELFDTYRATMSALERDYPDVTFVYTTAPLTSAGTYVNHLRTQYNSLVRSNLADKPVFDIAALEATGTGGARRTTELLGFTAEKMQPGYTTDGGHLNDDGARSVAEDFVRVVARPAPQAG